MSVTLTRQTIRDIVEWDVRSWESALPFWERCLGQT